MGNKGSSLARTSRQLCPVRGSAVAVLQRCGLEPPRSSFAGRCTYRRCVSPADSKPPSRRASRESSRTSREASRSSREASRTSREFASRSSRDIGRGRASLDSRRPSRDSRASRETPRATRRSAAAQAGQLLVSHAHELVSVLFPHVGLRGLLCLRATCKSLRVAVDGDRELWSGVVRSLVGPRLASLCPAQPSAELAQGVLLACACGPAGSQGRACVEALGLSSDGDAALDCVADVPALDAQSRLAFFLSRDSAELAAAVSRTRARRVPFKMYFACVLDRLSPRTAEAGRELARAVLQCYAAANGESAEAFARLRAEFAASGHAVPRDPKRCAELALAVLLGEADVPADELAVLISRADADSARFCDYFMAQFSWANVPLEGALGLLLARVRLPWYDREAVDRIVQSLARAYLAANQDALRMRSNGDLVSKFLCRVVWDQPEVYSAAPHTLQAL
eukprot:m51a1_g11750 hypothetical protein (455) ;mRNA; r:189529-190893